MELFFIILLIIGSWALPYIINYNKAKKELEEKRAAYLREIELQLKLESNQEMTAEEIAEWAANAYLLANLKRNDSINDDLDRR